MRSFLRILSRTLLLPVLLFCVSCDILGGKKATSELSVTLSAETSGKDAGQVGVVIRTTGAWMLDLDYAGEQTGWATLSHTSGSGYKSNVKLSFGENKSGEPRTVRVVLSTDTDAVEAAFTQTIDEADPLGGVSDRATAAWLELPETQSGDGLTWGWHSMQVNTTRVRNYSFYWSSSDHLSFWVAYPLNKGLISSGSRSNRWEFDPLIPQSEQACTPYGGFGSGYDRGHQLPSADRYSYTGNIQTFYPTNMTPQRSAFNQNIWAKLEGTVRDWVQSINSATDTLYVVTGCVVEGSSLSRQAGGSGPYVTVPTAYYKALLLRSRSAGYSACGIWLDHSSSASATTYSDMMSISDLEKKTGVNFFVNLPSVVGSAKAAEIESKAPSSAQWPL